MPRPPKTEPRGSVGRFLKAEVASPRKVERAVKSEVKNSPKDEKKFKDERKDERKVKPDVKPSLAKEDWAEELLKRGLKIREDQARVKSQARVKREGTGRSIKKRVSAKMRKARSEAMKRPAVLSPEFADVLGQPVLSRSGAASALWGHCKEQGMVNPENKSELLFDDHLTGLFGQPSARFTDISRLVAQHIDFTAPVPEHAKLQVKLKRGKEEAKREVKRHAGHEAKREAAPVLLKADAAVPWPQAKREAPRQPGAPDPTRRWRELGDDPEGATRRAGGQGAGEPEIDATKLEALEEALLSTSTTKREPAPAAVPPRRRSCGGSGGGGGGQSGSAARAWAQEQVLQWCGVIQAPQLAGIVRDYAIDGITLLALCEEDLRLLGLTSGLLIKRVLDELQALR